ncbi:MAG: hypothetical protein JNK37_01420 [Verrucomicrobiales bacterium]|nr:hypothetical protein [Verrucomicrobiales bacterium]
MNAELSPLTGSELESNNPTSGLPTPVASATSALMDDDDDFGDVELGERQVEACSMEEGCTVCQ